MGRLGERTWWAPAPLARLHARIGLRETSPGAGVTGAQVEAAAGDAGP